MARKFFISVFMLLCATPFYLHAQMAEPSASAEKTEPPPQRNLTSFNAPQTYKGTIPFKKSKNVTISFKLAADAKRVAEVDFHAGNLPLVPTKAGVAGVTLQNAGFSITKPIDVVDGKISSKGVLLFDLTVSDACIYGKVKLEMEEGATSWADIAAKNITTPHDVSETQCPGAAKP